MINIQNIEKHLYKMKVTDATKSLYADVIAENLNEAFLIFKKQMQNLTYGDTEYECINQFNFKKTTN